MKLVDRRLARIIAYEGTDGFVTSLDGSPAFYWLSPFSQGDGYATAAESMVFWLLQRNAKLSVHHSWFLVKEGLRPETLDLLQRPLDFPAAIGVCMATPGEFAKLPTPYKIGFTMYESTDPLRVYPEWSHQCNDVDRLFVPCEYCADVFEQFTHKPIDVVPLAINEAYCEPKLRRQRKTFRVVTFATLTGRKGPLEMIEVFQKAFPKLRYPDVQFVLKTRLKLLGSQTPGLPGIDDDRIIVEDGTWPIRRVIDWLYDADCMMFLSKGEGFGLTPREALATGLPVILSDNTGLSSVCDDRYNWPVPTSRMELSPLGGEWCIPDWDYAVDCLRDIYRNRQHAYSKGYKGGRWFVKEHGPGKAADIFLETLGRIDDPMKVHRRAVADMAAKPEYALPSMADLEHLKSVFGLDGYVVVYSYDRLDLHAVRGKDVVLGQQIVALEREKLRFAVDFLMSSGAKSVSVMAPSVYTDPGSWSVSRPWRLEELEYTLQGLMLSSLRYLNERQWAAAKVSRVGRQARRFGSVIDKRWKPT
jgi:glycosyltransferase involved in cell wall biosynthesis